MNRVLAWLRGEPYRPVVVLTMALVVLAVAVWSCAVQLRRPTKVERKTEAVTATAVSVVAQHAVEVHEVRHAIRRRDVRREVHRPDGTTEVTSSTSTAVEGGEAQAVTGSVAAAQGVAVERHVTEVKEERRPSWWRLHVDARWNALDLRLVPEANADLTFRLAGPLSAGAWGRRDIAGRYAGGVLVSVDLE